MIMIIIHIGPSYQLYIVIVPIIAIAMANYYLEPKQTCIIMGIYSRFVSKLSSNNI